MKDAAANARRPAKSDPSRPEPGADYDYKKRFYQSREVAADYDFHRWGTPERAARNLRDWRTVLRALAITPGVRTILDLPCGTGRFTGNLAEGGYEVVASDVSMEMMQVAREHLGPLPRLHGFVRADAEALPFRDDAFDCVLSIRFLFHVAPEPRVRMLKEMARVSRRWLVLEYRHKYAYRYVMWRLRRALGLTRTRLARIGRAELEREFHEAGLRLVRIFPVAHVFSDKWIVVGEKSVSPAP